MTWPIGSSRYRSAKARTDRDSVVNRPVRPEPGRNGAVFLRPDGDGRKGRPSTEKS